MLRHAWIIGCCLALFGCKSSKPASCVKLEACCKALDADDKKGSLGKFVGDAYDKSCVTLPSSDDACMQEGAAMGRAWAEAQTPVNADTPPREPAACSDLSGR
jgi:hypothetical protein